MAYRADLDALCLSIDQMVRVAGYIGTRLAGCLKDVGTGEATDETKLTLVGKGSQVAHLTYRTSRRADG